MVWGYLGGSVGISICFKHISHKFLKGTSGMMGMVCYLVTQNRENVIELISFIPPETASAFL